MATVRIIAEPGENFAAIEEDLVKALQAKSDDHHTEKRFDDPLMNTLAEALDAEFVASVKAMYAEILEVLKE